VRTSPPPKHRLRICLLSSHPFLLKQLQELLSENRAQIQLRQIELSPKITPSLIPSAGVYLVDAHGHKHLTQSLIGQILGRYPKAKFLVLSETFTEEEAFPLLRLGVKGLLDYNQARLQLTAALQAVGAGGFWVSRNLLSRFVDSILGFARTHRLFPNSADVSKREREILGSLLDNLSNKEIANQFNISERTVKFHVSNLLGKFGVQRRSDLILMHFQKTHMLSETIH
jgi:DNA-binding NarL/FixJ family response regulator